MIFVKRFQKRFFLQTLAGHYVCYQNQAKLSSNATRRAVTDSLGYLESFGQPTPWTHPHMLKDGEVLQGISLEEIKARRRSLMQNIQKFSVNLNTKLKNHVIVIPSSTKKYMSGKIPYVFRQNSNFLYLSGCLEPDSVLILVIDEKEVMRSILLVRPKDKNAELWEGPRTGIDNSIEFFGVDEAYSVDQLINVLQRNIAQKQNLTTVWYDREESDLKKVTDAVNAFKVTHHVDVKSPTAFIHGLRVIKSPAEAELMRQTCRIASESINESMKETKSGDSEHHIFARVDYKCRMRNASYLAYPPVVAAGRNATAIHYINNSQLAKDTDLILMDAGCEYGGYTSDITRTWPVNGSFTPIQKVLYDVVLAVQKDLLNALLKTGGTTLDELFDTMCLKLGKYLQEISLLPKGLSDQDLAREAFTFCPHHVSHYLGMDVHDTPLISRNTTLLPGMVCTVEPGIYISSDRKDVPREFRGLGLRIEDDIYIQSPTCIENLTQSCVKETESLEKLIKL